MQRREPVVPQLTVAELGSACYRGAYNAAVELVIQGTRVALDTQAAARLDPDLARRLLKGTVGTVCCCKTVMPPAVCACPLRAPAGQPDCSRMLC